VEAASQQSNVITDAWQAWNLAGDVVQPQGAKMLPGVLSVGGWVAGVPGVLATNIVIGGVGILAVYLVARRTLGPLAALAPAALLALTVAHLGLTRSPYSEPLTLVLILASVAWAWRGIEEGRTGALVAAGAASGSTVLCRIDGGVYALGVLVGLALVCAMRGSKGFTPLVAFIVPQVIMVGIGYWSLWRWSASYIERLGDEARTLGFAYAAVVVALFMMQAIASMGDVRRLGAFLTSKKEPLARIAAGATAFALVVLASRPLWMTDRRGTTSTTDEFTNSVVAHFQQREGYDVDGTRTYAEHTVTWLSYYLTWPILILAALGLAVLAYRSFTSRPATLVFLGAVAVPSIVYALRPAIVPDQLWAIRRFEPATLPGLAIAAGVGAWWLVARVARGRSVETRRVAAVIAACVMVGAPVTTFISVKLDDDLKVAASPYLYVREQGGARAQIDQLCDVIDGRPVVLAGSAGYFGSIRVMCDVPVVLALVDLDPEALERMSQEWGQQPVVITQHPETVWEETPAPLFESTYYSGQYALQYLPRTKQRSASTWYAGTVEADGTVTPMAPLP
jgi:hypothetical protein